MTMRRNLDLISLILETVVSASGTPDQAQLAKEAIEYGIELCGVSLAPFTIAVQYHVDLCYSAGFIRESGLTWEGHNQLECREFDSQAYQKLALDIVLFEVHNHLAKNGVPEIRLVEIVQLLRNSKLITEMIAKSDVEYALSVSTMFTQKQDKPDMWKLHSSY